MFELATATESKMKELAPSVLRAGLALVVIWFGYAQIAHPADWIGMVPDYATAIIPLPVHILVIGNAIFELLFGTGLILGFHTRLVAGILTLHLLHIVTIVGYNAIGVRDFGLATAVFAVFLYGPDAWSTDSTFDKNIDRES